MRVLFSLGFVALIAGYTIIASNALAQQSVNHSPLASHVATRDLGNSSYMIAALDEKNSKLCHMVEETPVCQGMAPQKSQTADNAIKASLTSSQISPSETSKTFLNEK